MNQNELLARVNKTMGNDYTHKSLFETIEDLLNIVDCLEMENGEMAEKHAEKDAQIEQLIGKLAEARKNSRYIKFIAMAEENLEMAQEIARLKEVIPV